jgi:hypothetical protein
MIQWKVCRKYIRGYSVWSNIHTNSRLKNKSDKTYFNADPTFTLSHIFTCDAEPFVKIVQLLKNFPAFYGTQRFVTVFARACHCSLS